MADNVSDNRAEPRTNLERLQRYLASLAEAVLVRGAVLGKIRNDREKAARKERQKRRRAREKEIAALSAAQLAKRVENAREQLVALRKARRRARGR